MLAISVLRVNSANNLDGIGLKPVKLVNFLWWHTRCTNLAAKNNFKTTTHNGKLK